MLYRRLGRAGVKVSEIAYGSWITAGGKYPKEESIACHKRAYELGINLFDTADVYQGGQAEEIVGEVLQSIPRKNVVLATKLGFGLDNAINGRGGCRKRWRFARRAASISPRLCSRATACLCASWRKMNFSPARRMVLASSSTRHWHKDC